MAVTPLFAYAPWVLVAFYGLLGFFFGGLAERKTYCMVVATHRILGLRYDRIYEMILVSIGVSALGTGILVATGIVPSVDAFSFLPGAGWFTLLGAFIFGFGMMLGQGCMVGMLWKSGSGYVVNWFELMGLALGTILFAFPIFNVLNLAYWWKSNTPVSIANGSPQNYIPNLLGGHTAGPLIAGILLFAAIIFVSLALRRKRLESEGKTGWRDMKSLVSSPYLIGSVFAVFMLASFLFGAGRLFNYLGVTTPVGLFSQYLLAPFGIILGGNGVAGNWYQTIPVINPFTFFILMIVAGSAVFSMARGTFRVRMPGGSVNRYAEFTIAFTGGFILAIGARIAQGCSVGGFWSGLAGLSLFGIVFAAGIIPGSIAGYYAYMALSSRASSLSKQKTAGTNATPGGAGMLDKAGGYIFSVVLGLAIIAVGEISIRVNSLYVKKVAGAAITQEANVLVIFGFMTIVLGFVASTANLIRVRRALVLERKTSAGKQTPGGS
jgi:hypothetical protein